MFFSEKQTTYRIVYAATEVNRYPDHSHVQCERQAGISAQIHLPLRKVARISEVPHLETERVNRNSVDIRFVDQALCLVVFVLGKSEKV